ncbi:MAG: phosphoribosylformimino-5-aminoimidazole carboxamide ribotide isomerase [Candidatus Methanoperedens sp.]|nr:phosphoribosylformimino-5-aminoimidazole carboxamide ribotide isomerase [Candidatus Methanoperedens sp.]
MFRVIFVLDILNGIAVHAIRGERSKYRPIQSMITSSSAPLEIISALRPKEVYIADLDRLQHKGDNFELIGKISSRTKTMVDTGVQNMDDIEKCADIADTVILGTETASLDLIETAAKRFPGRINVSIDIKGGRVLTTDRKMETRPGELVKLLNNYEIKDIIILNLDRVGTGAGIEMDFFKLVAGYSSHDILAGGGVRDMDDINMLKKIDISGALIATALHNGSIPPELVR